MEVGIKWGVWRGYFHLPIGDFDLSVEWNTWIEGGRILEAFGMKPVI